MPKYLIQFVADVPDPSHGSPPDHSNYDGISFGSPYLTNEVEQKICVPFLISTDDFNDRAAEVLASPLLGAYAKTIPQFPTALSLNQEKAYTTESGSNALRANANSMGNAACCMSESESMMRLNSAAMNTAYARCIQHQPTIQRTFLVSRAVQCADFVNHGHDMCNNHNYQSSLPVDGPIRVVKESHPRVNLRMVGGVGVSTNSPSEVKQSKFVDANVFANRINDLSNSRSELSVDVSSLSVQRCSSTTLPIKQSVSASTVPEGMTLRSPSTHNCEDIDSFSAAFSAASPLIVKDFSKPAQKGTAVCVLQSNEVVMDRGYRILTSQEELKPGLHNSNGRGFTTQTTFGLSRSNNNPPSFDSGVLKCSSEQEESFVGLLDYTKRTNSNKDILKEVSTAILDSCTAGNSMESVTEECTSVPMEDIEPINTNAPALREQLNAERGTKVDYNAFRPTEFKDASGTSEGILVSEARTLRSHCKTNSIPMEKCDQWKEKISVNETKALLQKSGLGTLRKGSQECSTEFRASGIPVPTEIIQRNESSKTADYKKLTQKTRSLSESRIPVSQIQHHSPLFRPSSTTWMSAKGAKIRESYAVGVRSSQTTLMPDSKHRKTSGDSITNTETEAPAKLPKKPFSATAGIANNLFCLDSASRTNLAMPSVGTEALVQTTLGCLVTDTCPNRIGTRKRQSNSAQPTPNSYSGDAHNQNSRVLSNVLGEKNTSVNPVSDGNYPAKANTNQNSSCVTPSQEEGESREIRLKQKDQNNCPLCPTSSLSKSTVPKNRPLASPPCNLFTGRSSNESVASAPLHSYAPRSRCAAKLVRHKFYIPESANIEAILSDPDDRRIKAICERYKCDVEVYSKLPWCGFLQYIVVLAASDFASLRMCARTLDYRLNWCLSAQLR